MSFEYKVLECTGYSRGTIGYENGYTLEADMERQLNKHPGYEIDKMEIKSSTWAVIVLKKEKTGEV